MGAFYRGFMCCRFLRFDASIGQDVFTIPSASWLIADFLSLLAHQLLATFILSFMFGPSAIAMSLLPTMASADS
jgi:hypothetical protein